MLQLIKNSNRVMETRDHFTCASRSASKNGASSKSQMSRVNLLRTSNMKVIISLAVMMVSVFAVNAQVFVGGGLGLSFSDGKNSWGSTENSGSGFGLSISPQVGYSLNDDLSMGVSGYLANSWSNNKRTDPDDPPNDREYKYFTGRWGFNVFGRHKLMGLGIENFSLFIEGSIGVQGGSNKQTENEITTKHPGSTVYGINARPVLSYKLSNKLDVLAYCNFLTIGYSYQTQKIPDNNFNSKNHNINLGFNSFSSFYDLSIGFIYKF